MEGVLRLLNNQPKEQCPKAFNIEPWPLGPLGHVAVMMPFATAFGPVYPESTEAMYAGVDTRVDGQGRANRPGQVPIDGDEGGVK